MKRIAVWIVIFCLMMALVGCNSDSPKDTMPTQTSRETTTEKSRRAQEKCGFTYHHTDKDVYLTLTNDIRTAHVTRLTREEWEKA